MTKRGLSRPPCRMVLAAVLAFTAVAVSAQQANDYLTTSTLTKLQGLDLWYGQYVRHSNIGALHYTSRAVGNNTIVNSQMRLSIGGTVGRTEAQEYVIGPDALPRSYTLHGDSPTNSLIVDQSLSRTGDGSYEWKEVRRSGKGENAQTTSRSGNLGKALPDAPSLEMAWLLVGIADWQPGDHREISFLGAGGGEAHTAEVRFLERGSTDIRGIPTPTTTLEFSEAQGDSKAILGENYHLIIAGGHLAAILPSSETAIGRIIIGTQTEARRDLPTTADSPDEARVRTAAASFWVAMFEVDAAAFDRLVDFDAFKSELALRDSKVTALSLQQIRDSFIEGARKSSEGLSKDDLAHVGDMANLLVRMSDIHVADSTGEVIGPAGSGLPTLRFQKEHDGVWRLVWLEGFK